MSSSLHNKKNQFEQPIKVVLYGVYSIFLSGFNLEKILMIDYLSLAFCRQIEWKITKIGEIGLKLKINHFQIEEKKKNGRKKWSP